MLCNTLLRLNKHTVENKYLHHTLKKKEIYCKYILYILYIYIFSLLLDIKSD